MKKGLGYYSDFFSLWTSFNDTLTNYIIVIKLLVNSILILFTDYTLSVLDNLTFIL